MCVCSCGIVVEGRRYGGIAHGQHDNTTDEQLAKRGSVTHLKATGLRDSLFRFWFSVQSQKNIGHIWGLVGVGDFGAETQRWEVRGKRRYRFQLHISGLITLSTISSFHTPMGVVTRVDHASGCTHILQPLYCLLSQFTSAAHRCLTHNVRLIGGLLGNCVYT